MKSNIEAACQAQQNTERKLERREIQLEFDYSVGASLSQTCHKPSNTDKPLNPNTVNSGED